MGLSRYIFLGGVVCWVAAVVSVVSQLYTIHNFRPNSHWENNNVVPGAEPKYGGAPSTPKNSQFDWCNWDRSVCCGLEGRGPSYPKNEEELRKVVTQANKENGLIRVVGAGHSMSKIVCDPHSDSDQKRITILSLDQMATVRKLEVVDEPYDGEDKHAVVTVGSGIRLRALNEFLWNAGWSMPNLGLIDEQSLAGAISTGTHGTGIDSPSLPNGLVAMRLMVANGTVLELRKNPKDNRDLFAYATISLGLLGVITEYSIKVTPRYYMSRQHKFRKIKDVWKDIDQTNAATRNYQFWHMTGSDLVHEQRMNKYKAEDADSVAMGPWEVLWASVKQDIVVILARAVDVISDGKVAITGIMPYVEPEFTFVARSSQVLHFPGNNYHTSRFSEIEFFVPYENAEAAQMAFIEWSEHPDNAACYENSIHPMRFVKTDDLPLSPFRGWPKGGAAFSYVLVHRPNYRECSAKMDVEMRKFGARMHWGKNNFMTINDVNAWYGKNVIDQFRGFVKAADPKGIFAPDTLKKMFDL